MLKGKTMCFDIKVKKKDLFFYLSYICLYVSLFLNDVYSTHVISAASRILKILAYSFVVMQVFIHRRKAKEWHKFVLIFLLTLFYGLRTGDLYGSILVTFIFASRDIEQDKTIKISMQILLWGTLAVLILCCAGFLPDVLTARNTSIPDSFTRHSLGFYHSNVMPLVILYLELYYVLCKRNKLKLSLILVFFAVQMFLYWLCNSRNAFGLVFLFTVLILAEKYTGAIGSFKKLFYIIVKYCLTIMSIFSFAMMFLLVKGGFWNVIDDFFSGRFRLSIFKMRRIGLHLINFMSNQDYASDFIYYADNTLLDTVVIDNGYLYVILRYGILAILFYVAISFLLAKKFENDIYALIVLLIVFAANFVDNDLVDYSFLAFILLAFNNLPFDGLTASKVKKRSEKDMGGNSYEDGKRYHIHI